MMVAKPIFLIQPDRSHIDSRGGTMTFRCVLLGLCVVVASSLGCNTGPTDEATPLSLSDAELAVGDHPLGFRVGSVQTRVAERLNAFTALMMGRGGSTTLATKN
ncbi:MAG: hypothetical protein CM1200mP25_3030 [Acidobacteriota bacterium]|nr:MAG: hypothetical protein CM1200mP25_3030 [Acidobacteriota bacterium]